MYKLIYILLVLHNYILFFNKRLKVSMSLNLGGKEAPGEELQTSHLLPPERKNWYVLSARCTAGAG